MIGAIMYVLSGTVEMLASIMLAIGIIEVYVWIIHVVMILNQFKIVSQEIDVAIVTMLPREFQLATLTSHYQKSNLKQW